MGGNRYGGRQETTEVLKEQSKTARRRAELAEAQQQLSDMQIPQAPKTEPEAGLPYLASIQAQAVNPP